MTSPTAITNGEDGLSVRTKLNQLIAAHPIYAEDFGGTWDGTSDNATEMQALIDAVEAAGVPATIKLPPLMRLDSGVTIEDTDYITFQGSPTTIASANAGGSSVYLISAIGCNFVTFRDLHGVMDADKMRGAAGTYPGFIKITGGDGADIFGPTIDNCSQDGFKDCAIWAYDIQDGNDYTDQVFGWNVVNFKSRGCEHGINLLGTQRGRADVMIELPRSGGAHHQRCFWIGGWEWDLDLRVRTEESETGITSAIANFSQNVVSNPDQRRIRLHCDGVNVEASRCIRFLFADLKDYSGSPDTDSRGRSRVHQSRIEDIVITGFIDNRDRDGGRIFAIQHLDSGWDPTAATPIVQRITFRDFTALGDGSAPLVELADEQYSGTLADIYDHITFDNVHIINEGTGEAVRLERCKQGPITLNGVFECQGTGASDYAVTLANFGARCLINFRDVSIRNGSASHFGIDRGDVALVAFTGYCDFDTPYDLSTWDSLGAWASADTAWNGVFSDRSADFLGEP